MCALIYSKMRYVLICLPFQWVQINKMDKKFMYIADDFVNKKRKGKCVSKYI